MQEPIQDKTVIALIILTIIIILIIVSISIPKDIQYNNNIEWREISNTDKSKIYTLN
mgnify:CR=1 FL=1|tara:strand:+ start:364 stop:534 length:171 start_codon:yes stop_codon:yes gene_type:complete